MLRTLAIIVGLILLILGILGFLPDFTPNDKLLGWFSVNPIHNAIHLVSGIIGILCGLSSGLASKMYFIIFGLIYIIVGAYGFYVGNEMLLGIVANNKADSWLHVILGVIFVLFGVSIRRS